MNLLKELAPYNGLLDQVENENPVGKDPQTLQAIEKLADIWMKFSEENTEAIYGTGRHVIQRTDTSCGSCVKRMLILLTNWRRIERRNPDNGVYHKMVPPKKGHNVEEAEQNAEKELKEAFEPKNKTTSEDLTAEVLKEMDWDKLVELAKKHEVTTHRKRRVIIEDEILAKLNLGEEE